MSYIRYDPHWATHTEAARFTHCIAETNRSNNYANASQHSSRHPNQQYWWCWRLHSGLQPLYQQIKGLILQSLEAGEWRPGELIPSEMELAARFKVSQGTVRKAIDELAAENLVMRRQGKGTFVATHAAQQVQYRFLKLHPDAGDLQREGRAERYILECRRLRAPAEVARALALRTGDAVMHVRRILSLPASPPF